MNEYDTGLVDKSGKPIYIGDTLQLRLGKFAKKSGGPTNVSVIKFGKHIQIISAGAEVPKTGGRRLSQNEASMSVIIDREVMR